MEAKTVFARSLFDTKKWYFPQIFQLLQAVVRLKGLVKIPRFCVKQRLCKHHFKNECTLVFRENILKGLRIGMALPL